MLDTIEHLASNIQHLAMSIKLMYRAQTSIPVEMEGLTPDWAVDKSIAEIERFEIFHGNRKIPLAEMFAVAGDPSDKRFEFEGNLAGVHWIGAHMRSGRIHIHGPAGRHVGSEMRGGGIVVEGDAAGWVGCEMRGGVIHVKGNAGHLVGSAYRGSAKGMTGGTIVVEGDAGNEIGLSMQQGVIAIGGNAGDMLGFNMKDGQIIVVGDGGVRVGAGMLGGTIVMLGPNRPALLPSFRFDHSGLPHKLAAAVRDLRKEGLRANDFPLPPEMDLYVGDLVAHGAGEVWLQHSASS
jgi:formylmethanofuran dehydrogenase subunit C